MNAEIDRQNKFSDDGYGSDETQNFGSCPKEDRLNLKLINKEAREFRNKYFTQKVLNNSANGVIYQGNYLRHKIAVKFISDVSIFI